MLRTGQPASGHSRMILNWSQDRRSWRYIARWYLPCVAVLNGVWEVGQVPLYTIWRESSVAYVAFAIIHCTVGDVLIGAAALLSALILLSAPRIDGWPWSRVTLVVVVLGTGYTLVSEWMNTALLRWQYSDLMPTISIAEIRIGVSPLLQWIMIPPLAIHLARWRVRRC